MRQAQGKPIGKGTEMETTTKAVKANIVSRLFEYKSVWAKSGLVKGYGQRTRGYRIEQLGNKVFVGFERPWSNEEWQAKMDEAAEILIAKGYTFELKEVNVAFLNSNGFVVSK